MKKRWLAGLAAGILILPILFGRTARADNENYGEDAYRYMKIMNDCFGYRINNKEITADTTTLRDTKDWIAAKMAEFGYQAVTYTGSIENHDFISLTYRKPGRSGKRIVIGAHYDSADTFGCEDNGTGVGMVLELAKRFYDTDTPLTLEFCFWDGEEYRGMAGSFLYLEQVQDREDILCYFNLDCLGAGDEMYAYGGDYDENGVLQRAFGYNMAMTLSRELGIDLHEMPDGIDRYVKPTRTTASDQYYFNVRGIPYVYFEANAWLNPEGVQGNPEKAYNYNSSLECFADTGGRIIHTKYDRLEVLESLVPGRIRSHLTDFSRLISEMIRQMDEDAATVYAAYVPYREPVEEPTSGEPAPETASSENGTPETSPAPETSASVTQSEAPETTSAAVSESSKGSNRTRRPSEDDPAEDGTEKMPVKTFFTPSERIRVAVACGIIGVSAAVFLLSIVQIVRLKKKKHSKR